jgi:hypothetical protein
MNVVGTASDSVNRIRQMAQTMYESFMSYLDSFYKRFNTSIFEISRIIQHLRMAVGRANAIAISMIYTGITMFRGMINSIQFVIKVVLIICGVMLAIIIILFFILFPVIPLILAALATIGVAVGLFASVLPLSLSTDAQNKASGFCLATDTIVFVKTEQGVIKQTVQHIKVGDILVDSLESLDSLENIDTTHRVTEVITMTGENIPLYDLHGIYVSGSHLVKGTDRVWKSVTVDERAIKT